MTERGDARSRRSSVSFDPPAFEITSSLEWVLHRALGPERQDGPSMVIPEECMNMAGRLALGGRIRRRTSRHVLESELGAAAATEFCETEFRFILDQMQFDASCRMVAQEAADLGIPVVFLKGLALRLLGLVHPEDRPIIDVDVLATEAGSRELWSTLQERKGFKECERLENPHHLTALWHPRWRKIDTHHLMAGVEVFPGGRVATYEQLRDAGVLLQIDGFPPNAAVPNGDLTIAHLAVHCLHHHPNSPSHFFRFLCDFQTMLERDQNRPALPERMHRWIAPFLDPGDINDLARWVREAAECRPFSELMAGSQPAARAARHFSAMALDEDYRRSDVLSRRFMTTNVLDYSKPLSKRNPLWWTKGHLEQRFERPVGFAEAVSWNLQRYLQILERWPGLLVSKLRIRRRLGTARRREAANRESDS